jgi:hypothetical protein
MSDTRRLLSPSQVALLKAAEYIEEHGWCQRSIGAKGGPACVIGAVHFSGGKIAALNAVERVIGRPDLIRWNDEPGRTKAEVVKALRGAAFTAGGNP